MNKFNENDFGFNSENHLPDNNLYNESKDFETENVADANEPCIIDAEFEESENYSTWNKDDYQNALIKAK